MSLFVLRRVAGLKKIGAHNYEAVSGDPQFVYHFWLRRPRYLVVFLDGGDYLDPRLYIDRGNGFDERTSIALNYTSPSIYIISVAEPRSIRTIRFDPSTYEGRLRYWAAPGWTETDRERLIAKAKGMAQSDARTYEILVDGKREKRRRNRREWVAEHYSQVVELARRTAPPLSDSQLLGGPFISFVIPVYNTPKRYLDDLLASFREQPGGSAELIFSDDGSTSQETLSWLVRQRNTEHVTVIRSDTNRGIARATNAGIARARGRWVAFLDHDDALTPGAVQLIAEVARKNPTCKFIYTDEVVTDSRLRVRDFHFKPAYDEVLLSGVNYINHLSCYQLARLNAIGGMREGYEGSQDYDLVLRYLRDLKPNEIKHLPYPAYRWRRSVTSFSTQFLDQSTANARRAIGERYARGDVKAEVDGALTTTLHRLRLDQQVQVWPRVSVVIPNRNSLELISRVISDLAISTDYPELEIIVVDNGTTDDAVLDLYARTAKNYPNFRFEIEPRDFNFSRQANRGIELATGELVLLLNNDIEVTEPLWLREMVSCFQYRNAGIVGARLLYPNKRLQHAGVIIGISGLAGHWFLGQSIRFRGPMGRLHVRQSFSAVTGACMLISRTCLDAVGRFDEKHFAVAYNDVDFCLRAVSKGFRVIWTPFATLIHHESATRGSDSKPANRSRFQREKDVLRRRHGTDVFEDPAFNPWYTRDRLDPFPFLLEHLPCAR